MPIVTKHSSEFKESDLKGHNKALAKMREALAMFGMGEGWEDAKLADFTSKPGFYGKFKSQWKGPFDSARDAIDAIEEWKFESKH